MNHSIPIALETLRHSTAHLLAHAVKQLFPGVKVAIGPVIENGFYYDFAYDRGFNEDDLVRIEKKMRELVKQKIPVTFKAYTRDEAIHLFESLQESYKIEILRSIPESETITVYQQGDFQDLCRGPHVENTGLLTAFKLMRVAGAYWKGDVNNPMLQRIYGTAWQTQEDLKKYLYQLEEAVKRDHRKLGPKLNLFHLQEDAPGMVFWHAKGWTVYQIIENYLRKQLSEYDYQEIHTPQLLGRALWEQSGHWEKFYDDMFVTQTENKELAIKPMNCPGHVQVFKQQLRSYKALPLRFSEFGCCHRNEPSGGLHGLMRVRSFVQDDAHIFCREQQLQTEVSQFIDLLFAIYKTFDFHHIELKLATRPDKRVGSSSSWDKAEQALIAALDSKALAWKLAPGEGAFYGPKIEFTLRDSLNRLWQCGTIQVDFSMPERLDAFYIDENNERQVPIMLHRAILGSLERFIGILIEHHAGKLPLWLAPVQVVVMNITEAQSQYADIVAKKLKTFGLRVEKDLRNEKISLKIREHVLQKIPYQIIIGSKEEQNKTVSLRSLEGNQKNDILLEKIQSYIVGE